MRYSDLEVYESEFIKLKEIIEKMEYKNREWFIYHLNPHYFNLLFYQVEKSDKLMSVARANYSADFCEKLKTYCKDAIKMYVWDYNLRENYTILGFSFKKYSNDPDGLEWTPDNIDRFLWDWYNKVDVNPWTDKKRVYDKDWFNRMFKSSYDAFIQVWGEYVNAGDSERIKTAVKMEIIRANIPDYYN